MALMTGTLLTMAVNNCPEVLKRISRRIPSASLEEAALRYDTQAVNEILEKEVCRLLGTDNLYWGLRQFCQRFGIQDDQSPLDDIGRILLIDQHRRKIDEALRSAGV